MPKKRYAIGTWHQHPGKAEDWLVREVTRGDKLFSYVIGQQEISRRNPNPNWHLQYVVYNRKGLSFAKLCARFPGSTYTAYDDNGQSMVQYVQKRDETRVEGTQFEAGERPCEAVGKLTELIEEVKHGEADKEKLLDKYGATYARAYKAIAHCIELKQPKPQPEPDPRLPKEQNIFVCWFYGDTATGKTARARYLAFVEGYPLYVKTSSTKQWWDDYRGETAVLFDDFRGNDMSFHEFLQLTDPHRRLSYRVQSKGAHVNLEATLIIVTSPKHPIDCWQTCRTTDNDWQQLRRRLTKIWYCSYWKQESDFDPKLGATDVTNMMPPL